MKMRAVRYTYSVDGNLAKVEQGTVASASNADWANMTVLETAIVGFDSAARPSTYSIAGPTGGTQALTQVSYDADGRPQCSAVRMNAAVFGSLPADACTLGTQGADGPDRITKLVYDPVGQVTQVQTGVGTSAARNERTLGYSNNGLVTSLTDGNTNQTQYQYDGQDRLSKTSFPSTDYELLTYENTASGTRTSGTISSRQLRDGTSIAFTYDALGRVTLKTLPGTEPAVSYGYDNLGRLTSASETGNSLTFKYDALSRLTDEIGPHGTVHSDWNLDGTRSKLTYADTGLYVNYDYFLTGEVEDIRENGATTGHGVLATYAYDDLGNRTSVTFGNGAVQSYAYDPVSRLTTLTNDLASTTNDLTIGGASTPIGYNAASQIITAPRSNDAYSYGTTGSVSHTFGVNSLNQYITNNDGTTTKTLTFDRNGNLTSDGANSFCYSSENLLLGMNGTCASPSVSLTYDPLTRLSQVAGSSTTQFGYDGLNMLAEYNGANTLQRRYVFAPGIDQPIVWYEGSAVSDTTRRFLSSDERGSIISVTDSTGVPVTNGIDTYDEYGIPGSSNTADLRFGYTGQAWVPELGMYYYKARVYSPTLGRFMQIDPIGYADNPNFYAYVNDDPVNASDLLGLEGWCGGVWATVCGHRQQDAPSPTQASWENRNNSLTSPGERNASGNRGNGSQRSSTCTGFFANLAGAAYKEGGAAQVTGAALAVAGAMAQAGDVTPAAPATVTVGGSAIIVGSAVGIGGAVTQGLAGLYYLAHGNPKPFASTVIGTIFHKSVDSLPDASRHPGVSSAAEQGDDVAQNAASGRDNHGCKPE